MWRRISPTGSLRAVHHRRAGVGGDQRAADRAGPRRGLRLRLVEHVPRSSTYNATNYWVDVVYTPTAARPGGDGGRPVRGPTSVSPGADVTFASAGGAGRHGPGHGDRVGRGLGGRRRELQRRGPVRRRSPRPARWGGRGSTTNPIPRRCRGPRTRRGRRWAARTRGASHAQARRRVRARARSGRTGRCRRFPRRTDTSAVNLGVQFQADQNG